MAPGRLLLAGRLSTIQPQACLCDVLDRIRTRPARRIVELLPDRWRALRGAKEAAEE